MPNSRCIETGAREGVYLGTQIPVTRNRAHRAEPGAPVDHGTYNRNCRCKKCPFSRLFFKTCNTMLRQWLVKSGAVFETCISMLRQWEAPKPPKSPLKAYQKLPTRPPNRTFARYATLIELAKRKTMPLCCS